MKGETLQELLFYASNYTMPISPWKRRLREDLVDVYEYLMGGNEEDGARVFSGVSSDRTRGNERKLKYRKFHLCRKKNFFTVRVVKHWSRVLKQTVESLSLETL